MQTIHMHTREYYSIARTVKAIIVNTESRVSQRIHLLHETLYIFRHQRACVQIKTRSNWDAAVQKSMRGGEKHTAWPTPNTNSYLHNSTIQQPHMLKWPQTDIWHRSQGSFTDTRGFSSYLLYVIWMSCVQAMNNSSHKLLSWHWAVLHDRPKADLIEPDALSHTCINEHQNI